MTKDGGQFLAKTDDVGGGGVSFHLRPDQAIAEGVFCLAGSLSRLRTDPWSMSRLKARL